MTDPETMDELRDAYYDIYDAVFKYAPSSPDDVVGELMTSRAQGETFSLFDELIDEGYTEEEVEFLSMIAVADAIEDKYQAGVTRREIYGYDYDEED